MSDDEDYALECVGLVHVYRTFGIDVAALRGVDLRVASGQRVALLGPSGSGKSTLLSIAAGAIRPSAGRVLSFGADIGSASEKALNRIRRQSVGLMLQGASTNLLLHEDARGNVAWASRGLHQPKAHIAERVLTSGGIEDIDRPVGALSPSQQQIVALAVAMAAAPRLLLVDEPTSQLDEAARDRLLDLLVSSSDEQRTAVLLVTHDEEVARRMQRMVHMRDGRVGEEATIEGRYSVIGSDGSIPLPDELRQSWPTGALVSVSSVDDEIRIRRAPSA